MGRGDAGRVLLPALLAVLLVLLAATAVVQLRDRTEDTPAALRPVDLGAGGGEGGEADERAAEAVAVARSAVEAFYGLDHRTLEADLAEVRALATGEFAEELDVTADRLRQQVRRRRLVAVPTLVPDGTATASLTTARAEVLVSVDVVRRADGEREARRGYRTRVELVRADGTWRVSGLDAVT